MKMGFSARRKAASALVAAAFLCVNYISVAFAQSTSIVGHWEGHIQLPNTLVRILVDFTKKEDSPLKGHITMVQQSTRDMDLTNISVSGPNVNFDLPGAPGDPKFSGKLDQNGKKIEGQLNQAGHSFPFILERKESPVKAAQQALEGFDQVATDSLKKLNVPGMSIAIIKGKDVIYAKGFGFRDVEKQQPVTADTLFAIGSSSKAFTTFVLGTLVDEGKVEWDKPVRNYIPWFKLYDPYATERMTPRDLVTHRSGLPRHDLVWYNNYNASRKSLVEKLPYLEPSADLRTKFQYNNLMFLTAGYLEEVMTGKSWEENVKERILDPLGMTRTNFSVDDSQKDADFAEPYAKKDDKIVKIPFRPITNIGPAGAINSSANEMIRWVEVQLNGGLFQGKHLVNASTVAEMHTPQMTLGDKGQPPDISSTDYGMGWFIDTYRGHRRVYHGGNIDGFSANVVLLPDDDIGFVILTNMNGTPLRDVLGQVIADRLLGLSPRDWIGETAAKMSAAEAANKEGAKKKDVARIPNTQPSHKMEDYLGEYENPGYNPIKISMGENGNLEATFNGITTPLEHWHYDTFSGMKTADGTFENMKYTFQTNSSGFISAVAAPFEPAVKEIVFTKKPDSKLFDADYLKRFVGEYEMPNQVFTVALKGNVLTANPPGQPPVDLIPALGGDFELKANRSVKVHFVMSADGTVTGLELRQPGATLAAKKK